MSYTNQMSRLQAACREKSPLCIGLDTDISYLPESVAGKFSTPAEAVLAYNRELVAATGRYAACYKVQIAYYEAMGLAGLKTFADTLKCVKAADIPVISDVKRGDIADTAKAYARAHFTGDFETDIITVNPYMGFDTLEPFAEYAEKAGKGMFVLLRTSNPGMTDIENQELVSGGPVLERVGEQLLKLADRFGFGTDSAEGCSPIGAVVGCTEETNAQQLRNKYSNIFFLIPGYGAQGGAARVAATLLSKAGGTVNSSRGILCAWKKDPKLADKRDSGILTMDDIVGAAAEAAANATADLKNAFSLLNA